MQSALPIGLPLERNRVSLGIVLLAGMTVFPLNSESVLNSYDSNKRYEQVKIKNEPLKGKMESFTGRDFVPTMLNRSIKQSFVQNVSVNEIKISTNTIKFTKEELKTEKQTLKSPTAFQQEKTLDLAQSIVQRSKAWIGVPYRYGGTTTQGVDCSGLVQNVFRELGIQLPRTSQEQFRSGVGVPLSQLKPGDLIFFSTSGPGASHVGIYIGNQEFVSATREKVEIQSIEQPYWNRTYRGSRRVLQ